MRSASSVSFSRVGRRAPRHSSAHAKLPASTESVSNERVSNEVTAAREDSGSYFSGTQQSLHTCDKEESEDERPEVRERSLTAQLTSHSSNNRLIAAIPKCSHISAAAADATKTVRDSYSGPTSQKLQKQCDLRELQIAFRALVTHVVRIEPALEPTFSLKVTTISTCANIVFVIVLFLF